MEFSPAKFDRHFEKFGQDLLWWPSFSCSCTNPDTGSPDPTCRLCMKKGRIWEAPVPTVCAAASQKTQAEWANLGLWEAGDMVVSIPQSSAMWDTCGQYDRVTMLNATDRFSMSLRRGAPNENLSRFRVVSVDRVFWRHATTQALVEGGIPAVATDGTLSWADRAPPLGTPYSISGLKNLEYFVWGDFPSNRNMHRGKRLPKRVILRRWDLMGRG